MASKSKGQINYAQRLRAIRPYVDFDYDLRHPLSSAAKAQITRYYQYIQKLTVRPHQIYRSRNADNLRAVQRFAQHNPNQYQRLTVAFVPNAGGEKARIRIDAHGRVHAKTGHISQIEIPIDPLDLVEADEDGSAEEYINEQIDNAPAAKRYVVQAGEFEVPSARSREFITAYVLQLMAKYGTELRGGEENNHHYKNWMFGIAGYNFENQAQLDEYRSTKRALTKQRARANVTERKREKRLRENPPGFWLNDEKRLAKRARPPQPTGWRQVNQRQYYKAVYADGYKEIKDRTGR